MYRSKLGGEEWYINMENPNHDPRTDPQTPLIRINNIDGGNGWKIQNTEVRYNVFTSSGYKPQLITTLRAYPKIIFL